MKLGSCKMAMTGAVREGGSATGAASSPAHVEWHALSAHHGAAILGFR